MVLCLLCMQESAKAALKMKDCQMTDRTTQTEHTGPEVRNTHRKYTSSLKLQRGSVYEKVLYVIFSDIRDYTQLSEAQHKHESAEILSISLSLISCVGQCCYVPLFLTVFFLPFSILAKASFQNGSNPSSSF